MTHLIIAGHGKQKNGTFDPGATGFITKGEHKYVVEDLFPVMKKYLPKDSDVVFFSEHKVSNYGDLVSVAKKYSAKTVTEIHYDAATATARGGHVIIHKKYSPDELDLALRDAIKNMVGVRYSHKGHAGISGRDNLFNVNVAANNGINYRLIELGFGTNKTDSDIMVNEVDRYAKELVKAIVGNIDENKTENKPSAPTPPPSKPTPQPSNKTYKVVKSISGYINANDAKNKKNKKTTVKEGIYYVFNEAQGMINVSAKQGVAGSWINPNENKVTDPSKPKPQPTPSKKYNSIVDYLVANKIGSSFTNRKKLADKHGIRNYTGTAAQNTQLLNILQGGDSASTAPSKPKLTISQMADKIINDKKAPTGHTERQKWLGVDKATYEKVRQEVNKRFK